MNGLELNKIYSTSGLTGVQFAEKIGISRALLYNIFKQNTVDSEIIEKLNASGLYRQNAVNEPNESYIVKQKKGIPIYDLDFTAGDVTQFNDFQEKIIGHIDLNGFRKCVAFVKVKGNSMFPAFTAGDLVGLEPVENFSIIEYGQPFAIVTKYNQSLIKIIRKGKDNDNLILRSNNKEFDDIDIHKKDILRLYKAHGPVRDSHY